MAAVVTVKAEHPDLLTFEEGGIMVDFAEDRVRVMCGVDGKVSSPASCG